MVTIYRYYILSIYMCYTFMCLLIQYICNNILYEIAIYIYIYIYNYIYIYVYVCVVTDALQ